jgi:hypothetical protein
MKIIQPFYSRHMRLIFSLVVLLIFPLANAQYPIRLHLENHRYFQYNGKPVLLITSAEHYGALINLDFDYITYLDALHAQGLNDTRIFTGSYIEGEKDIKWMGYNNTLAPRPNRLIVPWQRSNISGYYGGGNKFDLEKWDENYFQRLKDLMTQAQARGIIIEVTLFGNQYSDSIWIKSPLYPRNNIQGAGPSGSKSFLIFQTLSDKQLLKYQEAYVQKMLKELNSFDNLYYEISNEPYNDIIDSAAVDSWHNHMVQLIKETEKNMPKKHLIATCFSIIDNPDVSIANFHYVRVPKMQSFEWLLALNKVINMDETIGSVYDSDVTDTRIEAWDHILRGGGAYNNLSWEYTPCKEAGTDSAKIIREQLQYLQKFMGEFDYIHMAPDHSVITAEPRASFVRVLSEAARQYAIYLHHSKIKGSGELEAWGYHSMNGTYEDRLALNLPIGTYRVRWMNPSTGVFYDKAERVVQHKGGILSLLTPEFQTDIALQVKIRKEKYEQY